MITYVDPNRQTFTCQVALTTQGQGVFFVTWSWSCFWLSLANTCKNGLARRPWSCKVTLVTNGMYRWLSQVQFSSRLFCWILYPSIFQSEHLFNVYTSTSLSYQQIIQPISLAMEQAVSIQTPLQTFQISTSRFCSKVWRDRDFKVHVCWILLLTSYIVSIFYQGWSALNEGTGIGIPLSLITSVSQTPMKERCWWSRAPPLRDVDEPWGLQSYGSVSKTARKTESIDWCSGGISHRAVQQ